MICHQRQQCFHKSGFFFCTRDPNKLLSSEFFLSLQSLWLLQGNPAADRSRDAEEGGEGEMGGW